MSLNDESNFFKLYYYYKPSKICADINAKLMNLNIPIEYVNIQKIDTIPEYVKGVPTLIVMPEQKLLKGSEILEFVNIYKSIPKT